MGGLDQNPFFLSAKNELNLWDTSGLSQPLYKIQRSFPHAYKSKTELIKYSMILKRTHNKGFVSLFLVRHELES